MIKKCKGCGTKMYNDEKYCKKCAKGKLKEQLELNTFLATLNKDLEENKDCFVKDGKKGATMKGKKGKGGKKGFSY